MGFGYEPLNLRQQRKPLARLIHTQTLRRPRGMSNQQERGSNLAEIVPFPSENEVAFDPDEGKMYEFTHLLKTLDARSKSVKL
jgi:hypothetical protein